MSAENTASTQRGAVLDKAKAVINGDRQDQYGNPEDSFDLIAFFWNVYINKHLNKHFVGGKPNVYAHLEGKDIGLMMALMKFAREMNGAGKEDNLIDAAGYIGLAADMSNYKENSND